MPLQETHKNKTKKRDLILSEAVRQFNKSGYHDTRLEDIAHNLGKTKTSISYHFQSKEALLEEAFAASCAFTEQEYARASKKKTGLERVLCLIENRATLHAQALAGQIAPVTLLYNTESVINIAAPELRNAYNKQIRHLFEFVEDGKRDLSIRASSSDAVCFFILNILHWLPEWLVNLPNARHIDAIHSLCDILRHGIASNRKRLIGRSLPRPPDNPYPAIFNRDVRSQLKKDAILRTGTRHLNLFGFRSLSLNDVAKELGVTRGAFYYYITDKEALLEECFFRALNSIETALARAKNQAKNDHLHVIEHALFALFEGHITGLEPLIRLNLIHALDHDKQIAIDAKLRRIRAGFTEVIAEAIVDKSIRPVDLNIVENLIFGSIFTSNQWRLAATPLAGTWNPSVDPGKASINYYETLLKGLAR